MSRILVIEDVAAVRRSIRMVLARAVHEVAEAPDGETALALLKASEYDLVVADVWMPGIDGIALLKEVRALGVETPFLVVSGGGPKLPLAHSMALAETYGAAGQLYKPFEEEDLLSEVNRILG